MKHFLWLLPNCWHNVCLQINPAPVWSCILTQQKESQWRITVLENITWCFNRHRVPRKAVASAARMSHKPLFKYCKVVISCFCYFETEEAKENIWMCSPEVRAEVWFGLVWIKEKRPRTTRWFTLFQDLAHSLDQVQNPMTLCQKMLRKEQR